MKISTKTRYGMRFMLDLAAHYNTGRVPMKDIAERQGISKKYLEQVVSPFNSAGLLDVSRGQHGGFRLSRPPSDITLAEIVDASEEGLELLDCLSCLGVCDRISKCPSRFIWNGMQDAIANYLAGLTLADVLEKAEEHPSF